VDPTITHGFPLWTGYGNFLPTPSIHTPSGDITFPPSEGGGVQEFIFWTLNQARSQPNVPPPTADLLPLAFFNMICAQWILMCEYINTRLGQIEYEIELGLSTLYNQDYDHTVKTLLTWRRRMPIYHAFVERSISRLSVRYKSTEATAPFSSWEDILTNLRDILKRLEILHCRADKIMNVSMAVTAREESKDAERKTRAFTRVQYLAFIFVPLGFWTGFFGMSSDIPLNVVCLWAEIALPITACVLGVLLFVEKISRCWRRVRKDGLGLRASRKDKLHHIV
jgi:Mg2+ and Co2+ transporter CorA